MSFKNLFILCVVSVSASVGCSQSSGPVQGDHVSEAGHDHDGWWCDEHGVPEEVCARCNFKLVADFKAKGDWCNQHDRPDSQCFICHPEKESEFAAQYEAKYGKKPPQPASDDKSDSAAAPSNSKHG
jgi:cobalt-zinc-cadmium efflux system membrane fusion protein